MQHNLSTQTTGFKCLSLSMLIISAIMLSACGPLGDDEEDPTATTDTIAQPTGDVELTTPVDLDGDASPASDAGTPVAFAPGDGEGTPESPGGTFVVVVGTPVSTNGTASPETPTTAPQESGDGGTTFIGSDGTDGATPAAGNEAVTGMATPSTTGDTTPAADSPFFTEEVVTPAPSTSGTAQEGELADLEPVTVTSCEPESVPEFLGELAEFRSVTDVNFRTGPGADCDLVVDGPIGTGNAVTLLSGPVVRDPDDGFVWVQVQIVDDIGWVIVSAIEPVP